MNKNRKTSHILNVFQYDVDGHVVLPASLTLTVAPASNDNSGKVGTTAWVRTYVTGLSYLTGNQSITVSGDATGSGTTAISLTLANSGVTAGTYGSTTLVPVVTVDAKGRVTSVTTAAISGSLTFTGDVTGTGTTGTSTGLTLAASGVTAGTYTKVTVDTKGRVTVGASATTSDISEGTNLYYTDARVLSYLTANTYATQSYVGTQVANLVAAAPATLDTLNELAAALGNDPSFATTVSTSIGTKVPQTRTLTINGTGYDLSADRSWTINSMVYPSAGIALSTGTAWGTSITDNSANWNTAFGWGNHASGGYLTGITSSQVTTALGYTPYNSTNPSGYITGITSSNVTTALGYTPYNSTNPSGYITGITSGNVTTALGYTPYNSTNPSGYITGINSSAVTTALGYTPLSSSGSVTINGDLTVGVGNSSNIYMNDGDEGQRQIHCNSNRIGFLTQAGAWGAYCDDAGNWNAINFSGSSSGTNTGDQTNISGNAATATSADNIDGVGFVNTGSNSATVPDSIASNGISYTSVSLLGQSDGALYSQAYSSSWQHQIFGDYRTGQIAIRGKQANSWQAWRTVIDSGNIGSQSVSNATTAGGLAVHSDRNNEANKIVRTDVNGYIQAGWINSNSGNMGFANRIARIQCSDDNYIRFQTLEEFKVSIGLSGKNNYSRRIDYTSDANYHIGSFGASGVSTETVWHYGSGFFDVWAGGGTFPGSMTHIHGFNALHYSVGAGGNGYGWQMASQYDRPGEYWARNVSGGTFSSWRQFITSDNIGSQSVSYASTAGSVTNGMYLTGTQQVTGQKQFQSDRDTSSNSAPLQAFSMSGGATMAFHRSSVYATNFGLDSDNVIRIGGWSASNNRLQMDMSGNLTMAGDVTAYSDARVKENIATIENALNKVLALRGVSYNRIDSDDKKTKIGVIAQETLPIVPEVVNQDNDGMYNVSYGNLAGLFIEAIKEQQKEIEELKTLIYGITR